MAIGLGDFHDLVLDERTGLCSIHCHFGVEVVVTFLLDQQPAFVVAHLVGDGFAISMYPLHHIVLPYRSPGA